MVAFINLLLIHRSSAIPKTTMMAIHVFTNYKHCYSNPKLKICYYFSKPSTDNWRMTNVQYSMLRNLCTIILFYPAEQPISIYLHNWETTIQPPEMQQFTLLNNSYAWLLRWISNEELIWINCSNIPKNHKTQDL